MKLGSLLILPLLVGSAPTHRAGDDAGPICFGVVGTDGQGDPRAACVLPAPPTHVLRVEMRLDGLALAGLPPVAPAHPSALLVEEGEAHLLPGRVEAALQDSTTGTRIGALILTVGGSQLFQRFILPEGCLVSVDGGEPQATPLTSSVRPDAEVRYDLRGDGCATGSITLRHLGAVPSGG